MLASTASRLTPLLNRTPKLLASTREPRSRSNVWASAAFARPPANVHQLTSSPPEQRAFVPPASSQGNAALAAAICVRARRDQNDGSSAPASTLRIAWQSAKLRSWPSPLQRERPCSCEG